MINDNGIMWLAAAIFFYILHISKGGSIEEARQLLSDQLSGYDKHFRPVFDQSQLLYIQAGLDIVSIHEFDEVQQKLTITAVLLLIWQDEMINWFPDSYGNISELTVPQTMVWTPNVVLTNNVDQLDRVGDTWHMVRVTYFGFAIYYPGSVFSASCQADVTYYPFDEQKCGFKFKAWGYDDNEIKFLPRDVETTYYSKNGVWDYVKGEAVSESNAAFVTFYITMKRKPKFVVINVILPIVLMSALNILIFLIPTESGERISYCITVLLALAVFLTLVGDNLPKTSSPMAMFSFYLLAMLVLSICVTLATIFSLHLYYQDENKPLRDYQKRFVLLIRSSKCRKRRSLKVGDVDLSLQENTSTAPPKQKCGVDTELNLLQESEISTANIETGMKVTNQSDYSMDSAGFSGGSSGCETGSSGRTSRCEPDISWKDVSLAFDRACFVVFFISLTVMSFVFALMVVPKEHNE